MLSTAPASLAAPPEDARVARPGGVRFGLPRDMLPRCGPPSGASLDTELPVLLPSPPLPSPGGARDSPPASALRDQPWRSSGNRVSSQALRRARRGERLARSRPHGSGPALSGRRPGGVRTALLGSPVPRGMLRVLAMLAGPHAACPSGTGGCSSAAASLPLGAPLPGSGARVAGLASRLREQEIGAGPRAQPERWRGGASAQPMRGRTGVSDRPVG